MTKSLFVGLLIILGGRDLNALGPKFQPHLFVYTITSRNVPVATLTETLKVSQLMTVATAQALAKLGHSDQNACVSINQSYSGRDRETTFGEATLIANRPLDQKFRDEIEKLLCPVPDRKCDVTIQTEDNVLSRYALIANGRTIELEGLDSLGLHFSTCKPDLQRMQVTFNLDAQTKKLLDKAGEITSLELVLYRNPDHSKMDSPEQKAILRDSAELE